MAFKQCIDIDLKSNQIDVKQYDISTNELQNNIIAIDNAIKNL